MNTTTEAAGVAGALAVLADALADADNGRVASVYGSTAGINERRLREQAALATLQARLLAADELSDNCTELAAMMVVTEGQLAAEQARAERLELVVKQYASECGGCNGTGFVGVKYWRGDIEFDADDQPCPDCADIRDALALRPSGDGVVS